jgi:hypothetical protein
MLYSRELKPRASLLTACFYCGGSLPASSKEHIFNSCWGGSHKTSQLICDACNVAYSHIDGVFGYAVKFVMNALVIHGERQSKVPEIKGTDNLKLGPGASPKIAEPTLEVKPAEKGYAVHVVANTKGEARRLVLDGDLEAELQRPLTTEEREQLLRAIQGSQKVRTVGASMGVEFTTDVKQEYRSAAHTLLKCLGMFEPEFVTDASSEPIRKFARDDQGEWTDFAVSARQNISPVAIFARDLGNFNAVEIYFSKSEAKVIGVVTILGRIKRAVSLSGYEGPDRLITVFERVCSNQLKAFELMIDPAMPPVPMVEVDPKPLTIEGIVHDSLRVISNAVSWDAISTKLFGELERTVRRHPVLNAEAIAEIRGVLMDVCSAISVMYRAPIDESEISRLLDERGVAQINSMVGNPSVASELQLAVARALMETIDEIRERASKAPKVSTGET